MGDIAPLDSSVSVKGTHQTRHGKEGWTSTLTWRELFALIAPGLLDHPIDSIAQHRIAVRLFERKHSGGLSVRITDYDLDTIRTQLGAYGLISVDYSKSTSGGMGLFWSLTPLGQRVLTELRAIRQSPHDGVPD